MEVMHGGKRTQVTVRSVIPQLNNIQLLDVMKEVFEQYDVCKRTPGNSERDEYVKSIDLAVGYLSMKEQEIITQRFLIDFYRKDYEVFSSYIKPSMSKDTYTKHRNRALATLFITLSESGIIQFKEEEK